MWSKVQQRKHTQNTYGKNTPATTTKTQRILPIKTRKVICLIKYNEAKNVLKQAVTLVSSSIDKGPKTETCCDIIVSEILTEFAPRIVKKLNVSFYFNS